MHELPALPGADEVAAIAAEQEAGVLPTADEAATAGEGGPIEATPTDSDTKGG